MAEAMGDGFLVGDETVCAAALVNNLDQRGYERPGTGYANCSIGAYEYNSPGPPTLACVGDCDHSGDVTDELITLIDIALVNAEVSACPNGVPRGAEVDIALIIQAVEHAVTPCPAT